MLIEPKKGRYMRPFLLGEIKYN